MPSVSPGSRARSAQLRALDLSVERAGNPILDAISLTIAAGDRIGLVGPNGVGKSTLLRALAGELEPTRGSVTVAPSDATVGLLTQEIDASPGESVADLIARKLGVASASATLDTATDALAPDRPQTIDEHQAALDRWIALGGADLDSRLGEVLDTVGLTFDDPVSERAGPVGDRTVSELSGGEQARVGLAALLLARHDILLLDEPTNDLDQRGLSQLEEFVLATPSPMVVVSHDRRFLDRVVTAVLELDGHDRSATLFSGTWSSYLAARETARQHAALRFDDYRAKRSQLTERARLQRQWSERGVRAERTPPDGDRAARGARIERTEKQASKARQSERALERLEVVDKPWEPWELRFTIGAARRSGEVVAELREAVVHRGTFRLGPLSLLISAGDRVMIVGENGAGKTTLVRALLGEVGLDGGYHHLGRSVVAGRLDQARQRLTTSGSFVDGFSDETGLVAGEARTVLAKFGLTAAHLSRPSIEWSPGERTRAVLAAFQATGVNTLVLDEPTNHLDVDAIEQLEAAVEGFDGTLIVVSHDRAFLENVRLTRRITIEAGALKSDEALG